MTVHLYDDRVVVIARHHFDRRAVVRREPLDWVGVGDAPAGDDRQSPIFFAFVDQPKLDLVPDR